MAVQTRLYTVAEFEQLIDLPENAERRLELAGGEIIEVVSNNDSSMVALEIATEIKLYLKGKPLGYMTGEAGGYTIGSERYIPDVAFISKARQPEPCRLAYNPIAPDLVVEVLSPTDDPRYVRVKIGNYLAAGVVVWIVDPEAKAVEVYTPGQPVQRLNLKGVLGGGSVLPGFALVVSEIFPD